MKLPYIVFPILICWCFFSYSQEPIYCKYHNHYVKDGGHIANAIVEASINAKKESVSFDPGEGFIVENNYTRRKLEKIEVFTRPIIFQKIEFTRFDNTTELIDYLKTKKKYK